MRSWTPTVLAVLLLGAVVAVFAMEPSAPPSEEPVAATSATVPETPEPKPEPEPEQAELVEAVQPPPPAHGYDRMPDGSPVPPLPASAPRRVTFGVVLFQFDGAQGAPSGSRTKEEAFELAKGVVALAQTDFTKAVEKGDRGSTSNAGGVPRGILEPSVEYALFTLAAGTTSAEPVPTPRGYWVVRRIK